MTTAILFLLILSVLVLIHEAGHYFAALIFGVKPEEFGYGFPPRAIGFVKVNGKWKKVAGRDRTEYKNTIWSINWLPLGGFVRLKGEAGESADSDSFLSKPGWQKFIILAAGVVMNWLFAAMVFSIGFSFGVPAETRELPTYAIVSDRRVQVTEVVNGSAAQQAGFRLGDRIITIDGETKSTADEFRSVLAEKSAGDSPMSIVISRNGQAQTIETKAAYVEALGRNGLGVALTDTGTIRFPVHLAVVQGFSTAFEYTKLIIGGFFSLIRDLFVDRKVTADLSGPVGIAVLTGTVAEQGFWALMQFSALLSLNLAVINFLPIPALDGGRALFVIVETLRRKRNDPRFEAAIHQLGFVALLILIFLVTAQDLRRYGGAIWGGLKGLIGL